MVDMAWLTDAQLPIQNASVTTVKSKEKKEDLEVAMAMVGAMEKAMEVAMEIAIEAVI